MEIGQITISNIYSMTILLIAYQLRKKNLIRRFLTGQKSCSMYVAQGLKRDLVVYYHNPTQPIIEKAKGWFGETNVIKI